MGAPSSNGKSRRSIWRGLLTGLFLIVVLGAYGGWQYSRRYQIESEVLAGYKNDNRELVVVLSQELENEPGPQGVADNISRALADRLQRRGYSVQLVRSETIKGRASRERIQRSPASTSTAYTSGTIPLTSQALARAAQGGAGALSIYLSEVSFSRSKTVNSETYVLELLNPDHSPAWKATLTYRASGFEDLLDLYRLFTLGDRPLGREEGLTDLAIARMQQQDVLK